LGGAPATGTVGTTAANITIALTGVGSSGAVGTVTMTSRGATLTGVASVAQVGTMGVIYWSLIDDSQTASWQNIGDAQTPNWSLIDDAETPNWVLIPTE
jgi:hypothetical protein